MAEGTTPEAAKVGDPESLLSKMGAGLPVALAAIATTFAGLSSSEMSRAMYWRSAAAQDQAKATSQWTLAGFKRDRSLITQAAAASLRAVAGAPGSSIKPELPAAARAIAAQWTDTEGNAIPAQFPELDPKLATVMGKIRERHPEPDLVASTSDLPLDLIDTAIREAERSVTETEVRWDDALKSADSLDIPQATRFDLQSRRYLAEAKMNQGLSWYYEVRIRKTTATSDRHWKRSANFFYAMLIAQIGATGGSLALARHKKSALWLFAGLTGVVSVAFGVYVYLGM
jgi:hypothetical protein